MGIGAMLDCEAVACEPGADPSLIDHEHYPSL